MQRSAGQLRITSLLVGLCAFQAMAATLSVERATDPSVTTNAAATQDAASCASDGSNMLCVWTEFRDIERGQDIYGARVSGAGVVLDPGGIVISSAPNDQSKPTVAFVGGNFVVAWVDERGGGAAVYGARVSMQGVVQDAAGVALVSGLQTPPDPVVVTTGTQFALGWKTTSAFVAMRFSAQLLPLDAAPVAIGPSTLIGSARGAAVGTTYLFAWTEDRGAGENVYAARFSNGANLDGTGLSIATGPTGERRPVVSSANAVFLVAFERDTSGGNSNSDIAATLVQPTGAVGSVFTVISGTNDQRAPGVTWDGSQFVVGWQDCRKTVPGCLDEPLYAGRVSVAGAPLDTSGVQVAATGGYGLTALALSGGNTYVVWPRLNVQLQESDIVGARLSSTGTALDAAASVPISISANHQAAPQLAFDGTNYLAVWTDRRAGYPRVLGTLVTPAGVPLDNPPLQFGTISLGNIRPQVVFGGGTYVVAWVRCSSTMCRDGPTVQDRGIVLFTRVSPAGVVESPGGFGIAGPGGVGGLALGFGGTNFVVVMEMNNNLGFTRVPLTGAPIENSPNTLIATTNDEVSPAVGSSASGVYVTWLDSRNGAPDIYGARINDATAAILDPGGVQLVDGAPNPNGLRLTTGSGQWLLSYQDGANARATRISFAGTLLDGDGKFVGSPASSPAASWDGTQWLLARLDTHQGQRDVVLSRLAADLSSFDTTPFLITPTPLRSESWPAVAASSAGSAVLAYERYEAPATGAQRVWLVSFSPSPGPQGSPCQTAADCQNGVCSQGVCCDRVCGGAGAECETCSAIEGAATHGTCGVRAANSVCRASQGSLTCDPEEICNGTSVTCPSDNVAPGGTTCACGSCSGVDCVASDGGVCNGDGGTGSFDGGVSTDGGIDGGVVDGGTTNDGGTSSDGGVDLDGGAGDGGLADGGVELDGGISNRERLHLTVGCGCSSADVSALWIFAALIALRRVMTQFAKRACE